MSPNTVNQRPRKRRRKSIEHDVDADFEGDDENNNVSAIITGEEPLCHPSQAKKETLLVTTQDESRREDKQPAKGFMDLPPEVRNKIYEEALTSAHGIDFRREKGDYSHVIVLHASQRSAFLEFDKQARGENQIGEWDDPCVETTNLPHKWKYQISPNLLSTSKTVRSEALGFLYHQPFIFPGPDSFISFLGSMTPATIAQLRDITILNVCDSIKSRKESYRRLGLLQGVTDIQNLRLVLAVGWDTINGERIYFGDIDYFPLCFIMVALTFIRAFTAQHGMNAMSATVKLPTMSREGQASMSAWLNRVMAKWNNGS